MWQSKRHERWKAMFYVHFDAFFYPISSKINWKYSITLGFEKVLFVIFFELKFSASIMDFHDWKKVSAFLKIEVCARGGVKILEKGFSWREWYWCSVLEYVQVSARQDDKYWSLGQARFYAHTSFFDFSLVKTNFQNGISASFRLYSFIRLILSDILWWYNDEAMYTQTLNCKVVHYDTQDVRHSFGNGRKITASVFSKTHLCIKIEFDKRK